MRIVTARPWGALILSLSLVGCGGSQAEPTTAESEAEASATPAPAGPVSLSGTSEATATVPVAGGTLSLANGARLVIPSGALSEPTEVVLRDGADGQAFGDAERQRPLSPMLNIAPMLIASEGAFEVSVPALAIPGGFEEADLAFAMEEVDDEQRAIDTLGTQTRWQFYPVQIENGRWVARVTGLPGHRVQFGVAR